MSGVSAGTVHNRRSPMSVRRHPHDPGVPIDYVVLVPESDLDATERSEDAGYEAGYAAGHQTACSEAAEEARRTRARVDQALDALGHAARDAALLFAARLDQLEHSATAFAFELMETLLGRELALAEHPGRDAVARALATDASALPASVRLHPDDAAALCDADVDELGGTREMTIMADPSVERGGALVEIGDATIDSQLSGAVQRVREILIGRSGDADGDRGRDQDPS